MKIIGKPFFAKDADGNLESRIGTLFFRTLGLVTQKGIHATQRLLWIDTLNAERAQQNLPELSEEEAEEELAQSVDLIMTSDAVLVRPDPDRMDLALRADEELQKIVSKKQIRFLNTHEQKVRMALCRRGENWRIARQPISQEDMANRIRDSHVAIGNLTIYYYNRATGTRYMTAAGYEATKNIDKAAFRQQMREISVLISKRNRMGYPEIDLFPTSTPIEIKQALRELKVDELSDDELRKKADQIGLQWRLSLPAELRDENVDNFAWRNEMCRVLTRVPNDTELDGSELIQGISPEFYRQIEWLPGARFDDGELIFDSIWDEYTRTHNPELAQICDYRVRNIIFNSSRLYREIEYFNVGRIAHSLSRTPQKRRGLVYILQLKSANAPAPRVMIIRFQKWGVAEHLDEGKDLLQSILEANEYSDYVLDRRLMCQQLGMNLPVYVGFGQVTEPYRSRNQYNGTTVRSHYFIRAYIMGTATDKIPMAKFRNLRYADLFARLMGGAAALDMIVGRRLTEGGQNIFDLNYEVLQTGADGLPASVIVTDHAGSFVDYQSTYEELVKPYAGVVTRRRSFLIDVHSFARAYVEAFKEKLMQVQAKYRRHRRAFDELLMHRPFDAAGSAAYRWSRILERLDHCDPEAVANLLRETIKAEAKE